MKIKKVKNYTGDLLFFRKWRRKSYSLFQTLRKVVAISVLPFTYFLSVPIQSYSVEKDTVKVDLQYDLDEIEVSAQRSPVLYTQIARVVSVINRKEIEAAPVQSVQELLEYVAGVDIRQRGSEGVQADIAIRGGTFDQTLILLNGINITDPQTGHHNLNIPVSFSQIEKIEVLEGPAARVYGPNSFSGAINIITRQPQSSLVHVKLTGGSFGYFDGHFSGSLSTNKINQSISVGRKSSNGYIDNTDFKMTELFYSNSLKIREGDLFFQFGASNKGFGANSFYTPKYPHQFEEVNTLFSSIRWESNSKLHFTPAIYWRNHQDRFELFRDNAPEWYTSHNYHMTNTYGINLNSWFQWTAGKSAFGVEFRSENILSNVLGELLEVPKNVPNENAEYTKGDNRNSFSGFLEHAIYLEKWSVTVGILGNYFSGSNTGFNVFPGIDLSYNISSFLKAYASYNTSLRLPTFTDLYYSGPTNIGNPDLKPENSTTYEAGFRYNDNNVFSELTVFYNKGKNIIDWVKKDVEEVWQPQNLTRLNSLGAKVQFQFYLQKLFGKNFPNHLNISYFYNNLQKENSDYISNYVLDNLKHKMVISINQSISKRINFDLKINYQDRAGTYTSFENGGWAEELEYVPFWLFDGKLDLNIKKMNLYISVNNIFNRKYFDIGNVSQPGRWIKSGISYQIDFD